MIIPERGPLPIEVRRQYEALLLLESVRNAEVLHGGVISLINRSSFYKTRSNLVEATRLAATDDDRSCILEAIESLHLVCSLDEIYFYYDLVDYYDPIRHLWRLHVFHGSVWKPLGPGHGHGIVAVDSNGKVVSILSNRRPALDRELEEAN